MGSCRAAPSWPAGALTVPHRAEQVVRGERPFEDSERGAVERGVDDGTLAVATRVARVQRAEGGLRREQTGEVVGDRHTDAYRRAIGVTGEVEEASVADAHAIEARAARVRTVLAEAADAHHDEPRVEGAGRDVPTLERAGTKVLDHDVGRRGELAEEVLAGFDA
jgi:hypothetical protein